ncbi:hypothetical protein WISP_31013 [Willisornis vidua]|uniref:Uncharacterized protein n=1 Tax=Willisornis vidua TaxID=1566151 RepID=A0ABQ9DQG7_9PASS|nr:hypothetical protein WISP_31013 [Willisornis vidua]
MVQLEFHHANISPSLAGKNKDVVEIDPSQLGFEAAPLPSILSAPAEDEIQKTTGLGLVFPKHMALEIAVWEEGALKVMNGFAMFAKQMGLFDGHQNTWACPSWLEECNSPKLFTNSSQIGSFERKIRRLEVPWESSNAHSMFCGMEELGKLECGELLASSQAWRSPPILAMPSRPAAQRGTLLLSLQRDSAALLHPGS